MGHLGHQRYVYSPSIKALVGALAVILLRLKELVVEVHVVIACVIDCHIVGHTLVI